MNCEKCKELLVAYVEGLLHKEQKQAIESHLNTCVPCRVEAGQIVGLRERLVTNGKALAQTNLEDNVVNRIVREQKSKITKFAAAAVIIIAAISITYFLGQLATPTYAITQTIEANRGMRYVHTKYFDGLHDDVGKECWLEFDESGLPKNVRINWSAWMGGGQIQIVLWNQDQTQIWQKKRNRLLVFNDEIHTSRIHHMAEKDDPRITVEDLYERQAKGEVKIEIKEPSSRSEPIVVTATKLGGTKSRYILYVDQATKLVLAREWYQLKDGEYKYQGVMKYYDYNVPIDAKMFSLNDELSGDVKRIDTAVDDRR
jgi:hypothetical protein